MSNEQQWYVLAELRKSEYHHHQKISSYMTYRTLSCRSHTIGPSQLRETLRKREGGDKGQEKKQKKTEKTGKNSQAKKSQQK